MGRHIVQLFSLSTAESICLLIHSGSKSSGPVATAAVLQEPRGLLSTCTAELIIRVMTPLEAEPKSSTGPPGGPPPWPCGGSCAARSLRGLVLTRIQATRHWYAELDTPGTRQAGQDTMLGRIGWCIIQP